MEELGLEDGPWLKGSMTLMMTSEFELDGSEQQSRKWKLDAASELNILYGLQLRNVNLFLVS